MGSGLGSLLNRAAGQMTNGSVNPRTGVHDLNARDLIAQQMGGAPTVGRAPPPARIPGPAPAIAPPPPQMPPPQLQPQRNFGDIHAIMDYVQGRRAPPVASPPLAPPPQGVPPMVAPNVPTPVKPRPMMGK